MFRSREIARKMASTTPTETRPKPRSCQRRAATICTTSPLLNMYNDIVSNSLRNHWNSPPIHVRADIAGGLILNFSPPIKINPITTSGIILSKSLSCASYLYKSINICLNFKLPNLHLSLNNST